MSPLSPLPYAPALPRVCLVSTFFGPGSPTATNVVVVVVVVIFVGLLLLSDFHMLKLFHFATDRNYTSATD